MIKPELLAPAGDLSKLKTAIIYGADAVYIGGEEFSLRTACDNFTSEELKKGIDYAKRKNRKIYVAANVIMKNDSLDGLYHFAKEIYNYGADAVILSDLGALSVVKEAAPNLEIHVSTQANITNYASANMWHNLGASRVVLARELSYDEVKKIRSKTNENLELEAFVHGAMCVSYSGRCLLSNYLTGRDSNSGECAQPCRWKYTLMEEKRPGEYLPVIENENGSYFFNSKDLCLIEYIPELIDAGICSFKIEGRVKSEFYVATVVKAYRDEIDRYLNNPENYIFDKNKIDNLCKVSHRQYSHGFWNGNPKNDGQIYESSAYIRDYEVCGIVKSCNENNEAIVEQRNKFSVGDEVEIMQPGGKDISFVIDSMYNEKNEQIDSAPHARMNVKLKVPEKVEEYSMIRKKTI